MPFVSPIKMDIYIYICVCVCVYTRIANNPHTLLEVSTQSNSMYIFASYSTMTILKYTYENDTGIIKMSINYTPMLQYRSPWTKHHSEPGSCLALQQTSDGKLNNRYSKISATNVVNLKEITCLEN